MLHEMSFVVQIVTSFTLIIFLLEFTNLKEKKQDVFHCLMWQNAKSKMNVEIQYITSLPITESTL